MFFSHLDFKGHAVTIMEFPHCNLQFSDEKNCREQRCNTLTRYQVQYFPDNKTLNFVRKLSRTLQLDGEWELGLTEIDYPHTWYNICEGKNSAEIYVPDKWPQEISV